MIFSFVTFKSYRERRRLLRLRRNYEEIKFLVTKEHLRGRSRLTLPKQYSLQDRQSFRPPMYSWGRTEKNAIVLYWNPKLMSEEIGGPQNGQP